jgi:beta-phosphoglucomutase family hydrolase
VAPRLPPGITACLFDMDGVVTRTAEVHAGAWKQMFDEFLSTWSTQHSIPFQPFDILDDYDKYIDGRPRVDGTRTFLQARGIVLPEGRPDDPPDAQTVEGLSNRKNQLLLHRLTDQGVQVYPGSLRLMHQVRRAGMSTAVVSSSANTEQVLTSAGISNLFDVRVDAQVAAARHLAGKPAPDTYLAAADMLHVTPAEAAVFEDALAGVEAGRAGHFGLVVGVDRANQAEALKEHGADIVVADLEELVG